MDGEKRSPSDRVAYLGGLLKSAMHYDFFATVGMLERLAEEGPRIGGEGPYDEERIRFRHDTTLCFTPGEITAIAKEEVPRSPDRVLDEQRFRYEVTCAFLGVTGAGTPLPLHIAEEVILEEDHSPVKREFLDIFHNRLLALFYRLGIKFDFPREYVSDAADAWSLRILAHSGFDAYSRAWKEDAARWRLLRLAPLLGTRVRSARSLELALADVAADALDGALVNVQQFMGGWVEFDPSQRTHLGDDNSDLGETTVLGTEVFHRAHKARVRIGPLHPGNFRRFMEDGDQFAIIHRMIAMFSREPINFELDLVLQEGARPPFYLGGDEARHLGKDSWITSEDNSGRETHIIVPIPEKLGGDQDSSDQPAQR